jgi:hypothetical protein
MLICIFVTIMLQNSYISGLNQMTAFLAPNGKFYVFNSCGQPAVGGFMITVDAVTGAPKNTYSDPSMTTPNPPRMRIGSDGAVEFTLFWDISSTYYNYSTYDASGALIDEQINYPVTNPGSSSPPVTVVLGSENFAQNEQYSFWNFGTSFDNTTLPIGTTQTADMWVFTRSNTNATVTISRFTLPVGYASVPFSPTYAYRYQVTAASADSVQDHGQRYQDVNTLSNKIVFRGNYMVTNVISSTASVSLYVRQNFGTGGSAEVVTVISTFTVTDTPDFYFSSFTVPDVSTKVVGAGSFVEIGWRFNPSQIQDVLLMDEQFQKGQGTGILYPYVTHNLQYVKIIATELAGNEQNTGTDIIGVGSLLTPPIPDSTLTQYLASLNGTSNVDEYLIGWAFKVNPNQFGKTIPSVSNGQYIADQTILLSDGNGIVNKNSFMGSPLTVEILTNNKKFGIFQIIESATSSYLHSTQASLGARVSPRTGTTTFKMAVVGWSGVAGSETKNCVSAWNAAGTDPSLAANWSYVSEVYSFAVTASSSPPFQALNAQEMLIYTSYGVLIWNDSADLTVGNGVDFYDGSLTNSALAKFNQNTDFGKTLAQCQRYYYRTYSWQDTEPFGTITGVGQNGINVQSEAFDGVGNGRTIIFPYTSAVNSNQLLSSAAYEWVIFPQTMYKAPTINVYNPETGASGSGYLNVSSTTSATGGSFAIAASATSSTETGFNLAVSYGEITYNAVKINYAPILNYHYTADATLGV